MSEQGPKNISQYPNAIGPAPEGDAVKTFSKVQESKRVLDMANESNSADLQEYAQDRHDAAVEAHRMEGENAWGLHDVHSEGQSDTVWQYAKNRPEGSVEENRESEDWNGLDKVAGLAADALKRGNQDEYDKIVEYVEDQLTSNDEITGDEAEGMYAEFNKLVRDGVKEAESEKASAEDEAKLVVEKAAEQVAKNAAEVGAENARLEVENAELQVKLAELEQRNQELMGKLDGIDAGVQEAISKIDELIGKPATTQPAENEPSENEPATTEPSTEIEPVATSPWLKVGTPTETSSQAEAGPVLPKINPSESPEWPVSPTSLVSPESPVSPPRVIPENIYRPAVATASEAGAEETGTSKVDVANLKEAMGVEDDEKESTQEKEKKAREMWNKISGKVRALGGAAFWAGAFENTSGKGKIKGLADKFVTWLMNDPDKEAQKKAEIESKADAEDETQAGSEPIEGSGDQAEVGQGDEQKSQTSAEQNEASSEKSEADAENDKKRKEDNRYKAIAAITAGSLFLFGGGAAGYLLGNGKSGSSTSSSASGEAFNNNGASNGVAETSASQAESETGVLAGNGATPEGIGSLDDGIDLIPFVDTIPEVGANNPTDSGAENLAPISVENGQGGISVFQAQGLTEADWYSHAEEMLKLFPDELYRDGTDIRFAKPGEISTGLTNYINALKS